MSRTIYVVGMGPGCREMETEMAHQVLSDSDVIIGYTVYINLLKDRYSGKEFLSTPMKQEVERCRLCFETAKQGKTVSLVCSGDAGVYGLASLMYELLPEYEEVEIHIVPGITAANSGAALLGAPLNHDYCVISLSDLLTPWEIIEKRLRAAIAGDFAIALYNPSSHKRADYLEKACRIMLEEGAAKTRACGYVKNIGREGTSVYTCTLDELATVRVDMFTTVFIGNSNSFIQNNKLVTKRGYIK